MSNKCISIIINKFTVRENYFFVVYVYFVNLCHEKE